MKQPSNSNSHLLRSISLVIAVVTWAGLASAADQRQRADAGMAALQNFYNPSTGLFNTPAGWWQAANALETTIDFSARANTDLYTSDIATTFNKTARKISLTTITTTKAGGPLPGSRPTT